MIADETPPELRGRGIRLPIGILQRDEPEDAADNDLTIAISRDGCTSQWTYRTAVFDHAHILELQRAWIAMTWRGMARSRTAMRHAVSAPAARTNGVAWSLNSSAR